MKAKLKDNQKLWRWLCRIGIHQEEDSWRMRGYYNWMETMCWVCNKYWARRITEDIDNYWN